MLRFGADRIFAAAEGRPPSDAELDAVIDRSASRAATAGRVSFVLSVEIAPHVTSRLLGSETSYCCYYIVRCTRVLHTFHPASVRFSMEQYEISTLRSG